MTATVLSCWSDGQLIKLVVGFAVYGFVSGLLLGWAIWRSDGKCSGN